MEPAWRGVVLPCQAFTSGKTIFKVGYDIKNMDHAISVDLEQSYFGSVASIISVGLAH
jgi:hypothetical protein